MEPTSPTKDECNMAMLAHLLGIFTGFLGALVVWLMKKDSSAFVGEESKEALNFQITMLIMNFIFCILGAISASKGKPYKYPFAIRLLK